MKPEVCVLAATGSGTPMTPILIAGAALLIVGAVIVLLKSRRRRAALGAAAVGMLLVATLSTPAAPALAAGDRDPCRDTTVTEPPKPPTTNPPTTEPPTPKPPTPKPPTPEKKTPDLAASHAAPSDEMEAGSTAPFVFTIRNAGDAATSAPIAATISLPRASGFVLGFDPAQSAASIDGADIAVRNADATVTGSGTEADPFELSTAAVLAPGGTLSFAFSAIAPTADTASQSDVALVIAAGTGGGEAPTENNRDAVPLRAAAFVDPEPVCSDAKDKSFTVDTDADGVVDACDLDSDNDGIPDTAENLNNNHVLGDDDDEGVFGLIATLGDGVPSYLDLDSDDDSIPDLFEGTPFTTEQVAEYDADRDGILDSGLPFGANGLFDALETEPDSGVLRPEYASLRISHPDNDRPDFVNIMSSHFEFDLYRAGYAHLDELGGGFLVRGTDADQDGIQDAVDTDPAKRGTPNSSFWPY